MKLKKNNFYIVRLKTGTNEILKDLDILDNFQIKETVPLEFLDDDAKVRSYLRGAFLATGSVNNPETSRYHLEIYSLYEDHNDTICEMMNRYGLNARKTERRSGYITYLKEAEKIADFLSLIGATNAMLKFEDIRIVRDMRNSVNRIVNCETANLNKIADASKKQIDNIKLIDAKVGIDKLPQKLQEVAIARLGHPEESLKNLGELIPGGPISKSGINHRLRKLNEIAEKMARLDFSQKYRLADTDDEINELGKNINTMSDKLEATIKQLRENNSELEKDIEEKSKIDEMRKQFIF